MKSERISRNASKLLFEIELLKSERRSGLPEKPIIIAIDGRCASGKTTLARELSEIIKCPIFHMDDFFLRTEQRTPERFAQPGGNVDRERFEQEILMPLSIGEKIVKFRPYDCSCMALGCVVSVDCDAEVVVVEGSYSCHPGLWNYYDLHIFCDISPEAQLQRIIQRDGEQKAQIFKERWIPLEEKYFDAFCIKEKSDIVFEAN